MRIAATAVRVATYVPRKVARAVGSAVLDLLLGRPEECYYSRTDFPETNR